MIDAATTKPPAFDRIVVHSFSRFFRDQFQLEFWKTRERKPDAEVVEMATPPIIDAAEFEAVQMLLKTRSPALTAPRIVSARCCSPASAFCAACGKEMTLRTGKGGQYRYYTCSTKARQGETGCTGRTVPMHKLDTLVADHIERRLLQPPLLEEILSSVLESTQCIRFTILSSQCLRAI
jgi:site-specific DNA recombinase